MTTQFASGKFALGECDRCGFAFRYSELRPEVRNNKTLNIRVCRKCFDGNHPQETELPYVRVDDPQQLRYPRPQGGLTEQRAITPVTLPVFGGLLHAGHGAGEAVTSEDQSVTLDDVTQVGVATVEAVVCDVSAGPSSGGGASTLAGVAQTAAGAAAMPYFVRSTVSASTAETTHSFDMPPETEVGDVLVVCYAFDKQIGTTVTLDTGASGVGWTNTIIEATGARGFGGVAWKVAAGSDVLQFTTSLGEQSQAFAVCVKTSTGDVTVSADNNGATNTPNSPLCTPVFGLDDYVWIASAVSAVLDATPANTSAFTGYPTGYVYADTLTGQPNNPSIAIALKLATSANEDPGAFTTTRVETAITHTVGVRI